MSKKVLSIVESAYRGTIEEQDDTVIWLTHALRGAGAEVDVVLSGNAVNCAVTGQDASGLAFGERRQTQPPRLDEDVAKLIGKGAKVYVVTDDLDERGVDRADMIAGLEPIARNDLARLLGEYDQVWHW